MPMFFSGGNKDYISYDNSFLFFFRSNYAFSFSNDEYLLRRVAMKLIPHSRAKGNLCDDDIFTY